MTQESLTESTNTAVALDTLTFQSPPVLTPRITGAEQAAMNGAPTQHAKNFSTRVAILAGVIGGAIIGFGYMIGTKSKLLMATLIGAGTGGIAGGVISHLPWVTKPSFAGAAEAPSAPLTHVPTPSPTPAPTAPHASVGSAEHDGQLAQEHVHERV